MKLPIYCVIVHNAVVWRDSPSKAQATDEIKVLPQVPFNGLRGPKECIVGSPTHSCVTLAQSSPKEQPKNSHVKHV